MEPCRTPTQVPTFVALLQDSEAEVRTAAAFNSTSFAGMLLAETAVTHLLPCYRELSSDSSPHVRAAIASAIVGLAPIVGREATIEHLLPLFLQLLNDEFPEVQRACLDPSDPGTEPFPSPPPENLSGANRPAVRRITSHSGRSAST